jgi:hypothetical protein
MADEIPKPASAIMVEQPANDSWAVTIWSLNNAGYWTKKITATPSMHSWKGPEDWTITIPVESRTIRLSREADKVFLEDDGTTPMPYLTLARPVGIDQKITEIQAARERAKREYPRPRFEDAVEYRFKATYFLIFLLVLQEAFFAIYKRFTSSHYLFLRGLSAITWVVVGIWLTVIRVPLI